MRALVLMAGILPALLTSCASTVTEAQVLAHGRITTDFSTYALHRVGLLPFSQEDGGASVVDDLQSAFQAELSAATDLELVPLAPEHLAETVDLEPFRRGTYDARALLTLRERFRLDALVIGAVTTRRAVPPQRLGAQVDLVSCETGSTLWSASLLLDATDPRAVESIEIWATEHANIQGGAPLVLLSPHTFARFGAWQLAQLL